MRFLADENCDYSVIRLLRKMGHDVTAVAEFAAGSSDEVVLQIAVNEKRILITEDKDFGQLVYAGAKEISGVIFIRYQQDDRHLLPEDILSFVKNNADKLQGCFVVITPKKIRVSRLF